jgi:hypothetical protein
MLAATGRHSSAPGSPESRPTLEAWPPDAAMARRVAYRMLEISPYQYVNENSSTNLNFFWKHT